METTSVTSSIEEETEVEHGTPSCGASCCRKVYPSGFLAESKVLLQLSWPIVLTQICQMLMGPVSLIFCGHLGDAIQLDGAALSITFINVTCVAIAQGMGTSCDTFFSQCYGSNQKKLVGIYVQRAICIFTLVLLLCYTLHINMESLLVAIGQEPEVARLCGNYMLVFLPGEFCFFMYTILSKYIQNQNIVWPNVIIGVIANGMNALLHYLFLYQFNTGLIGSAIAQDIGYFLMFILTLLYIIVTGKYKDTWFGWSPHCLEEWGFFCRLALPGMLMVCMEWWGFEIGTLLTGILGTTELGAQSVILQIDSVWFQVPMGLQIASSQRIGQYLGAGNTAGAITVTRLILTVICVLSFIMSLVILTVRYQLAALFTNVEEVVQLAGDLIPIVCLYMFFDGIAAACKGVLFGTGRQLLGAVLLFVSYYCIALPIGIPLMFLTEMRSAAYWWALALNLILQAAVLNIIVHRTNWQQQAEKAQERAGLFPISEEDRDPFEEAPNTHEKTPLLGDRSLARTPPPKIRRLSTHSEIVTLRDDEVNALHRHRDSLGIYDVTEDKYVSDLDAPMTKERVRSLVLKRLLVLLGVLCVLGVGVVCRVLFTPQHNTSDNISLPNSNSTGIFWNASSLEPQQYEYSFISTTASSLVHNTTSRSSYAGISYARHIRTGRYSSFP